jgi:hypothetical protein
MFLVDKYYNDTNYIICHSSILRKLVNSFDTHIQIYKNIIKLNNVDDKQIPIPNKRQNLKKKLLSTTHTKCEFLPSTSLMAGLSPSGLPYTAMQCNETLTFSSQEKDKITLGKKQSFFPNETTHTKNERS